MAGYLIIDTIINVKHLKTVLGGKSIHQDVSFTVSRGTIVGIVGGSGSGKSVLLRSILSLLKPTSGKIEVFGKDILHADHATLLEVQHRTGILFQQSALFSSLTTLENIAFPLKHFTDLNEDSIQEIALLKLALVGLKADAAHQYPSQLSGGMQKRAALARAIALDPELLFLDEPSAGLDPVSATAQDQLLLQLQKAMQLTIVVVTHDLNTLASITDKIVFLSEGKIVAEGSYEELMQHKNPDVKAYFHTTRAKAAAAET